MGLPVILIAALLLSGHPVVPVHGGGSWHVLALHRIPGHRVRLARQTATGCEAASRRTDCVGLRFNAILIGAEDSSSVRTPAVPAHGSRAPPRPIGNSSC